MSLLTRMNESTKRNMNNRYEQAVTDEEAQKRIEKIAAEDLARLRYEGSHYPRFWSSLRVGDKFLATLGCYDSVTSTQAPPTILEKRTFRIDAIFPYVMRVSCLVPRSRKPERYICYVNIKELWLNDEQTVIIPTRREVMQC